MFPHQQNGVGHLLHMISDFARASKQSSHQYYLSLSLNAPDEAQDSVRWRQWQEQTIYLESAHYLHEPSWNRFGCGSQVVAKDLWSSRSLGVSGGAPRTQENAQTPQDRSNEWEL